MLTEPTVFIVDDDEPSQDSISRLAQASGWNAQAFDSAEEFLEIYDPNRPGCLVLDLRLPGMDGLELQHQLVERGDKLPVIFLSAFGDVRTSVLAMQRGAITFLEKSCKSEHIVENIQKAIEQDAKIRQVQARRGEMVAKIAQLTPKERDVMERIVSGKADKVIASELDISLRTVQFRKASILKKTGVDSWAALVELVLSVRNLPQ